MSLECLIHERISPPLQYPLHWTIQQLYCTSAKIIQKEISQLVQKWAITHAGYRQSKNEEKQQC